MSSTSPYDLKPQPGGIPVESVGELMSRLVDGDCDGQLTPRACARWRDDGVARATWHEYHLIGDLLRSEELCHAPHQDAAFLTALRLRLSQEPPIVAPSPAAAMRRPSWMPARGWMASVASLTGVAAVVGVVSLVMEPRERSPAAQGLATAPASPTADAKMIRDARIDLYLQAHHGMYQRAAATPGGVLRNVDVLLPGR